MVKNQVQWIRNVSFMELRQPLIVCDRLDLFHLTGTEMIRLYEMRNDEHILRNVSFHNPHRILVEGASPLAWRVPQVVSNPEVNMWFVRFLVDRASGNVVGSASFHGPPDDRGMLEIGLGVHEKYWRRGFAREALLGMWQWASSQPGVEVFRYTVSSENEPSIALVRSFGFPLVGQQIDETDGPEDIYEMTRSAFAARYVK